MPLYEYECAGCQKRHISFSARPMSKEEEVKYWGDQKIWCYRCDHPMKRLISAPASIKIDHTPMSVKQEKKIREPYWKDQVTGKIESAN